MALVLGGFAGPNGAGGAYKNTVQTDRAALFHALGGRQGVVKGFVHSGVAGQMALDFTAGAAMVAQRGATGAASADRGYLVYNPEATRVLFGPASASARNDAVVAAFVDVEAGPVGTGGLEVGAHLVVVPGVSGTTTPRTDTQINDFLGRGGWVRLLDVPIASGSTEIATGGIVKGGGYDTAEPLTVSIVGSFAASTTSPLVARFIGPLVTLQGIVTRVNNNLNNDAAVVQCGNLPAGMAPPSTLRVHTVTSQGTAVVHLIIETDGTLWVRNVGSAAMTPRNIEINATWAIA